jgi:MFS family permease
MKILTGQSRVPWPWAFVLLIPWVGQVVREQVSNAGMVFTLQKFTQDPAIIGMVTSTNTAFGFLVGSLAAFASDHIWTRHGRRRPFILFAWLTSGFLLIFIPQINIFWLVVVVIVCYQFVVDFGTPFEALTMEVIPSPQRGRAGVISQFYKQFGSALVMLGLIGGFDRIYDLPAIGTITGEQVMYWTCAVVTIGMGALLFFTVKEIKPEGAKIYPLLKIPFTEFFREIFSRNILPLLGLAFVLSELWMGIGPFESLLVTTQWGFSRANYGQIMSISMFLMVFLMPIGGWLSDRFDRLLLLKIGVAIAISVKLFYYVYVEFIAPGGIPSYHMVVFLGVFKSGVNGVLAIACVPLIFDYVTSNRLGILGAGMGIVFSANTFLNINVMGFWIRFSSEHIYDLPEGTYNYAAAYHWLFVTGLLGLGYLFFFQRMVNSGRMQKAAIGAK